MFLFSQDEEAVIPEFFIDLDKLEPGQLKPLEGLWHFNPLSDTHPWKPGPILVPSYWNGHGAGEFKILLKFASHNHIATIVAPNSAYTSAEFFLDGIPVAQLGRTGDTPHDNIPSNAVITFDLPQNAQLLLTIKVANYHHHQGGLLNNVFIGTNPSVSQWLSGEKAKNWFFIGLLFVFSVYHLALFFYLPKRKNALYLALFSFVLAVRLGSTGVRVFLEIAPLDYSMIRHMELLGWYLAIPLAYMIIREFFPAESRRVFCRIMLGTSLMLSTAALFLSNTLSSYTIYIGMFLSLFAMVLIIFGLILAFVRKRPLARILGLGFALLSVSIIHDILVSLEFLENGSIMEFGLLAFVLAQGISLLSGLAQSFHKNEVLGENLLQTNIALSRFVPMEFLMQLGNSDILGARLGHKVEKNMTVMFSDIRSFTLISENRSPSQTMEILNRYLGTLSEVIYAHGGFVDKFIGDGIMALFPENPENALKCGIAMQEKVLELNKVRDRNHPAIHVGIGIHTGPLVIGIMGTKDRMEPSIIADTVNVASRVESLCKKYGSWLLITQESFFAIDDVAQYHFRILRRTRVKGRRAPVNIIEILDPMPQMLRDKYLKTQQTFEKGLLSLLRGRNQEAALHFQETSANNPHDSAAALFFRIAKRRLAKTAWNN